MESDGTFSQLIAVPDESAGNIEGLCGNYNNDVSDDKTLPNGTDYTNDPQSDSKIATYFQTPSDENDTYVLL